MRGLLLKDFYNLSRMGKQYFLIMTAMLIWAVSQKNPGFISMYFVLCTCMLVLTSFGYDEASKFDKYALTMPIEKKTLVQEKFVLLLILVVGGTLLGILAAGMVNLFIGDPFLEIAATAVVLGAVFLITYSAVFPTVFKVGVEKARIMMVGVYLVIFIVIFLFAKSMGQTEGMDNFHFLNWMVPIGSTCLAAITAMISYFKSLKIVENKEW